MAETTQAASSTEEVADVFNGQQPTMAEYSRYRKDGELPERFKTAEHSDLATDDDPESTDETEGESLKPSPDSDPDDKQEPTAPTKADKRIKQLLAERYELEQKLAAATKPGDKQDSTPTKANESTQYAFPKPTAEDKNPDGTPKFKDYEDVVEAISRWAAKEERTTWEREHAAQEADKSLRGKYEEARERYEDADAVIIPASKAIQEAKIPLAVKEVFGQSEFLMDLCYVVGSDPDELEKFIALAQTNPRAAIGKVFEYERGIREALSTPRDDKGKFEAPETKKTSAPKPAATVNGSTSRAFDVSDESLSAEEWARQRRQQLAKKG